MVEKKIKCKVPVHNCHHGHKACDHHDPCKKKKGGLLSGLFSWMRK